MLSACKNSEHHEQKFDELLVQTLKEYPDAIGVIAHVEAPNDEISWSGAVGHSDWDKTMSIQANQPALIASITKTYMAVAILRLIEEEKLQLEQNLTGLLTSSTDSLMLYYEFDLENIQIKHLLSHKSGIPDYVTTEDFWGKLSSEPTYHWSRDEQIALAIKQGPLYSAGTDFKYADINYLLLGEILEKLTEKPFNKALSDLINFDKLGIRQTWFYTLDSMPKNTPALIHQYAAGGTEQSFLIDNSFDLYGGGGIATSSQELALFVSSIFQGNIFSKNESIKRLLEDVPTDSGNVHEDFIDGKPCEYYMGIQACPHEDSTVYWHLGYWGTVFQYYPDIQTTLTIFVVNQDAFPDVAKSLSTKLIQELK